MQEVRGALRMGRGGEDRALVVLQYLDPGRDIGSVIAADLGHQVKIGRKECRTQFGDKLLHGVTFIAETLAPEIAVKA
jgi:hypothetical protein